MSSMILLVGTLVAFILAYKIYGAFLSKTYGVDPRRQTPAHTKYDGMDFVPAKNWWVLFGHHFSSICGAGPIVGPVLAVAYWGWAPSLVWIVLGAILMGAVADYSSLILSVRYEGQSIAEIAKPEISPRARLLFSWFIWIAIILVIAVFALFGAKTLVQEPQAVIPSMGLIPVAVICGFLMYRKKISVLLVTFLGLALLLGLLFIGTRYPFISADAWGLSSLQIWMTILFVYCLVASVAPVDILLQPRDYLASFLLFMTIALGVISIFVVNPTMNNHPMTSFFPQESWPAAGPLFPMLFVTIACGAISGFHSLVSSGTTCKQLDNEMHACRIGYGGMLTEGLVAVMVLICVGGGLSYVDLSAILKTGGPIAAFGEGYGQLSSVFLGGYGKAFAILALNTFILTTLDSATRIARYLTMDLFGVRNKYLATLIVLVAAGGLAYTGQWNRIWPAFGTANQLIAGLSLLVASCWLMKRNKPILLTLIPAIVMLLVTTVAFIYQIYVSLIKETPDYLVASVSVILIGLSLIVFKEALHILRGTNRDHTTD